MIGHDVCVREDSDSDEDIHGYVDPTGGLSPEELRIEQEWNIRFSNSIKKGVKLYLNPYQRINHFPGSANLGKKDLMSKNINK